ncbi:MAG: hypothetical protein ACE5GH_06905, partial [Fidelibacterota bacterium]
FFHDVSQEVDLDDVLIVLSSDHGAAMLPEYARKMGMDGGRYGKRYTELLSEWNGLLEKRWGPGRFIDSFSSGSVYYDYATLTSKRVTVRQMDSVMIPLLMRERWIHKVYTRAQMMSPSTLDQQGRLWRNEFNPDRSGDLFVVVTENWVARGSFGTGHGTSHPYDTHVPLILSGRGLAARMIEDRVETVDVAPTVATLLGIPFPSNVDGKVLHLEGLPTDRRMD